MSDLVGSLVPLTLHRAYLQQPTAPDRHASFGEHGIVLWCDIARFSPLAKQLVAEGPTGVERLSGILTRHFDAVVATVTAHGGDAVQFYGDGVLVTFAADPSGMAVAARRALACAEAVITDCRAPVDAGLSLSLHLHLTAGDLRLLDFGGVGGERLYACAGDALNQLAMIARDQSPNRIIVSSALRALLPDSLTGTPLPHGGWVLDSALPDALRPTPQPAASAFEAPPSLAAFLPAAVRHGLEIGAPRWSAELRPVTSLFVTLPGLDCADPAFVARIHELALVAQAACRQHEGVLRCLAIDDKGTGFNLIFGLPPYAHRDDADRALRCADDLLRELALRGQPARVGVATGVAFVGLLGSDLRRQHAVIGDAINLASRLSHLEGRRVLCDEATMRASAGGLTLVELPPVQVKGWETPRPVWTLRDDEGAADRAPPPAAALFGRDAALAALRRAVDAAAGGDGTILVLSGEPGMGKSALLAHAADHARTRRLRVLVADCSQIEQATPYHALRRLFAGLLELDRAGTPEARRARVLAACTDRHRERISLLNAVLPLGLPDSPWVAGLLPAERVAATRTLLAQLVLDAALVTPLLLLIEDGHWIDDESLRLIERLARRPRGLTLLIAARPPALALAALHDDADAERIELTALDRNDSAALIASRLGAVAVDDAVLDLIQQRTEGNPFFVGELAQYLAERGDLLRTADQRLRLGGLPGLVHRELPVSVRATILNRIDAMAPSTRLTLKVESVSGTRGPLQTIVDVHPLDIGAAAVAEHLQAQRRLGLVEPTTVDGGDGYAFRQEITREVMYELVLPEMRQALHADLARWYETRYGDELDAFNGRIAAHWAAAGERARAAGYLQREAVRVFSNGHALEATRLGLEVLRLLDLDLPVDPAAVGAGIGREIAVVLATIGAAPPTAFATLPPLTDPVIGRRIAALLAMAPLAFQSDRMDLYALASITAMRLTLAHGSSPDTAQVYSLYSVVHAAIAGDRAGGAEWSRLALLIDDGGRQFAEVGFVYTWFHAHWQRPLRDSLGISLRAAEQGLASGALMYACFNLSGHVIYQQAAGRPLAEVIATIRRHLVLNGGRVRNSLFHLIHELQYAKALAGLTEHPLSFTDAEYDDARDLASILETRLSNQIGYYLVSRLKLACLHGRWDEALDWANRAQAARPAYAGQTAEFELVQYAALAAAGRALERRAAADSADAARASGLAAELRGWAALCTANFAHKALLAEGAAEAAAGGIDPALDRLAAAAELAGNQGFAQDEALALGWIARVLRHAGRAAEAGVAAERASTAWRAYGAAALA